MKKEKRRKKLHVWKVKHKRKKRLRGSYKFYAKPYAKMLNEKHRAIERDEISRFLKGAEEGILNFPYKHRHSAKWYS